MIWNKRKRVDIAFALDFWKFETNEIPLPITNSTVCIRMFTSKENQYIDELFRLNELIPLFSISFI